MVANCDHLQNLRFSAGLPHAFTEHGAVMLASVLNSDKAIKMNIEIVRIFTKIRQVLTDTADLRLEIEKIKKVLHESTENMEAIFQCLEELVEKKNEPRKHIGYKITKK